MLPFKGFRFYNFLESLKVNLKDKREFNNKSLLKDFKNALRNPFKDYKDSL
jgi:hypothetical protein